MIDNMDLIEKFYSENQELFEEITSKMDTMPGLVSRFFPIYAALKKYCDSLVSPKSLN